MTFCGMENYRAFDTRAITLASAPTFESDSNMSSMLKLQCVRFYNPHAREDFIPHVVQSSSRDPYLRSLGERRVVRTLFRPPPCLGECRAVPLETLKKAFA
mmetsp:Transcript_1436/g.5812  ORF Transcript_1436/g.5812 Transcript_1436/m.5812 type:complete len:101 (+) Transcript_1436:1200-1502(+)